MNETDHHSGIRLVTARISNFRSLREVEIGFDCLTVLIGENNSGKTSLLEALYAAIGSGRRVIGSDDLFLDVGESKPPKERSIVIDLLFKPADEEQVLDQFPEGSYWLELWGKGIGQDDDDNDFLAIRTRMAWDNGKGEYLTNRQFLLEWPVGSSLETAKLSPGSVSAAQLDPIALYLMDAKRDIQDELHSRSSFWHKLVSDPGLSEANVDEIEQALNQLNERIIDGSAVLSHVQEHLNDLYKTVAAERGDVSITPIARHLRDLSRGMDISFRTRNAQTFPLGRHGMGTRSLAAVLTFRAYADWRQRNAHGDAVHSMLALEEPEAHLHPQAQRALFGQIEAIPGQRIISTHSPYIASQTAIAHFRHFRKVGAETQVTRIDSTALDSEDLRKIDRMVLNTRGEMLFARALVFFEGETEEQALPVFARAYWGEHINTLGISMIGVSGMAYLPFVRLAESFAIPWFIFSDGEPAALKVLRNVLKKLGRPEKVEDNDNIFVIPDGKNFEGHLACDDYEELLVDTIVNEISIKRAMNEQSKVALKDKWNEKPDKLSAIQQELKNGKSQYAKPVAEAISGLKDEILRFPPLIRQLFDRMSQEPGLNRQQGADQ